MIQADAYIFRDQFGRERHRVYSSTTLPEDMKGYLQDTQREHPDWMLSKVTLEQKGDAEAIKL